MKNTSVDARGHVVYNWFFLKDHCKHVPGYDLIYKRLLSQLVIHPWIEIRIPKPFRGSIFIVRGDVSPLCMYTYEINKIQLARLRKFYITYKSKGWIKSENDLFISFEKSAQIKISR